MKRIFPGLLFSFLFTFSCQKNYPVEKVEMKISANPELLNNGKFLTMNLCGPCHYDHDSKSLSGKRMLDIPSVIGKVYASNITNGSINGIKGYTPSELKFLLKTGIKKDGGFSPFMVKPNLADIDIESIIIFLKSEDPLVASSGVKQEKTRYTLPGKIAVNHIFKPVEFSGKNILRPSKYDTVALGKYLVDVMGCYECHSSNFLKIDKINPENSKGYLAGGNKVKGADGRFIRIPNLTFDKETGIGMWSALEFSRALKEGITRKNKVLSYPMPLYPYLSNEESEAIYKYLKSIPAVKNSIERRKQETSARLNGSVVYEKYSCSACHGKTGKGVADLTKAFDKYSDHDLVSFIRNPPPATGMPTFEGLIKEEEFPLLIEYIKELGRKANRLEGVK